MQQSRRNAEIYRTAGRLINLIDYVLDVNRILDFHTLELRRKFQG